ncbi:MAG: GntR family transcriptional regulator [Actinomycetota bacterium]|nr:GntR family transcriptional regulator [Actinomycetota bacterium]
MEPQRTSVPAPLQVRIADELRIKIERGELAPGDSLPPMHELARQWSCSLNPVRSAIDLLKQQGLITGGRGKASIVRTPPRPVVRSSVRHQEEKAFVLRPETERALVGTAEIESKVKIEDLRFRSDYQVVPANRDVAAALEIDEGDEVLRRAWEHVDPDSGRREAWSVSHIPASYVKDNPALFDPANEPWPGGTQHQLSTVGIEIMTIIDEVTAHMPTTADARLWELEPGVPMLRCRRISVDQHARRVEISDAEYPADRTRLDFVTPLEPWPEG